MGVIQRQGIKSSIVNFFALGIGFLATIFIYPIDLEAKGLIDFILNLGALFIPYAQLGVLSIYYKYFTKFKNQQGAFQYWILKRTIYQFVFFLVLFFILINPISELLSYLEIDRSGNFKTYSFFLPLIILCFLVQGFLIMLSITNQRITIPDLIRNIIQKIYFPLIIIIKYTFDLSTESFLGLFFMYYCITIPLLFWYVKKNNFLKIKKNDEFVITNKEKKEINSFNLFSLLNDISTQLSFKLDSVMVGTLINLTQTGIYGIMYFISNVLSTATTSVLNISNPIISEKMTNNDLEGISSIYKKASITLLIFGLGMFFSIWFLLDDILSLTKYSEQLKVGKYVFLYLAISKLFDMLTSVNSHILIYSKHYKYNLLFVAILGVSNVFLNLKLIPIYGIEGAAMASLIALIVYNLMKLIFIYVKLKIHPFSIDTFKIFVIGSISFLLVNFIPEGSYVDNTYINLLLKGILVGSAILFTFVVPIYFFKVSKDINSLIEKVLAKAKLF